MSEPKFLNECPDLNPLEPKQILDQPPTDCPDCESPTQKDVAFFESLLNKKTGIGQAQQCDPKQTGQITQDFSKTPNRDTIYRYSRGIRGCDEAMMDLFRDIIVLDEHGIAHPVPIIWGTQERAVAAVLQTNVRKDDSLVIDRVRLPMMAIYSSGFAFDEKRYTYHKAVNYFRKNGKPGLTIKEKKDRDTVLGVARGIPINISYRLGVWTLYVEDMNQIVEQITTKFSQIAYIRIQGVHWEVIVKLDSIESNIDMEPGDTSLRVIKFEFGMTAESYIPQPIDRKKAVLEERITFANSVEESEITEIFERIENSIEGL